MNNDIKLCKDCVHMERGFISWLKPKILIKCNRNHAQEYDFISGTNRKVKHVEYCVTERPHKSSMGDHFDGNCGEDAEFFSPRYTSRIEPSQEWPRSSGWTQEENDKPLGSALLEHKEVHFVLIPQRGTSNRHNLELYLREHPRYDIGSIIDYIVNNYEYKEVKDAK